MKWSWFLTLVGLILYMLVFVPGLLPHTIDMVVAIAAGVTITSVAVFGFVETKVTARLASFMIILSLLMLGAGILLAQQDHVYSLIVLSLPATGLGLFGVRKLFKSREND